MKLYVRESDSSYRVASSDEIVDNAKTIIKKKLMRIGKVESPNEAKEFLMLQLGDLDHEVFACLFLDNRHQILSFEELFNGTINSSAVYPREVMKRVLHHNAVSVIFAHNHPSGYTTPSTSDINVTKVLVDALKLIDVSVLDHIIVGKGECSSMCEMSLI